VASRNLDHAASAAEFIGGAAVPVRYVDVSSHASRVIIAVTDRAIAGVAEEIASPGGGIHVGLHTCGSFGPELLAPLAAIGASCGAMHPLQTLRGPSAGSAALRIATFAVCGDGAAFSWAEELARAVSGRVIHIGEDSLPLYHAAAVMASNCVVALLDAAEQLMLSAGVPRAEALPALSALVRTSIDNAFDCGPVEALTGPVARGDSETVAQHLHAMKRSGASTVEVYRSAGLHALGMARRRGLNSIDAERVQQTLLG
jgi:predicted short-subunit dehydrogenase-like oxidoreductase (DUF2520 family)